MPPERPTNAMARSSAAAATGVASWLRSSAASSHPRPSTSRPRISHQSPSRSASLSAAGASLSSSQRQRGAEVVGLEIEPPQARLAVGSAQALRQREVPAGVPLGQCFGLAGLDQPLARVLPDHREQPVARFALAPPRPRRATCARVGTSASIASSLAAYALDGREVECAGEDRQAAEQLRLVRLEQAVAPVERALQRLLPRIGRAPLLAQQPERLAQPDGDLARATGSRRERRQARSPAARRRGYGRCGRRRGRCAR